MEIGYFLSCEEYGPREFVTHHGRYYTVDHARIYTLPDTPPQIYISGLVGEDSTRDSIAYGNDVDRHLEAFRPYADAGFDAVHIAQIGGRERVTNAKGFFELYRELLPQLHDIARS